MKHTFAQRPLLLMLVMLCSASIALAGYQPVWEEHFSGGTYDQTWTDLLVGGDAGTFNIVSSDDYYPAGLVFPNPSGDNYALRCDVVSLNHGTRGLVGGENTWTEYMVSIQMFVCISTDPTHRGDTCLMGRTNIDAPHWGSGVKLGYYPIDPAGWSLVFPGWGMRKNFDTPAMNAPEEWVQQTLPNQGWYRLTLVFSGTDLDVTNRVDAYVDKSYEEIVNDINASTPPLIRMDYLTNPGAGEGSALLTAGGVGFYAAYADMISIGPSGAPLYVDDIEVYLPPYELEPSGDVTAADPRWTLYE